MGSKVNFVKLQYIDRYSMSTYGSKFHEEVKKLVSALEEGFEAAREQVAKDQEALTAAKTRVEKQTAGGGTSVPARSSDVYSKMKPASGWRVLVGGV